MRERVEAKRERGEEEGRRIDVDVGLDRVRVITIDLVHDGEVTKGDGRMARFSW